MDRNLKQLTRLKREIRGKNLIFQKECNYTSVSYANHDLFSVNDARVLHARLLARPGKNTELKRCPFCPFVLNGLVLSLLTLKSPFWPVLWPFCPVLCPF